jgi:hypothetical protein
MKRDPFDKRKRRNVCAAAIAVGLFTSLVLAALLLRLAQV